MPIVTIEAHLSIIKDLSEQVKIEIEQRHLGSANRSLLMIIKTSVEVLNLLTLYRED